MGGRGELSDLGRGRAVLVLGALLVLSAACGSGSSTPPASTGSDPPSAAARWPLTGRASDGPVDRPALAVKIENSAAARPQSGLAEADMVWEEVVEGGITRYVAVYHSDLPAELGPVRSVRPTDPAIVAPLGGLFAFSGGQPDFIARVEAAGLQVLSDDGGAGGFHRVGDRSAPHNLYADASALLVQADGEHRTPPPEQFVMAVGADVPTAVDGGTPTATVDLTLSGNSAPRWSWSEVDDAWLRWEDGVPAVGADGEQLRATNVVVLRVDVVLTGYRDAGGHPVPETLLVDSGKALVATGGRTLDAGWSKESIADPVRLAGPTGAPVLLAPGNTWVELVPTSTGTVETTG